MILVISVCKNKLSEQEFVRPVTDILEEEKQDYGVVHYKKLRAEDLNQADKIIICGTQLKDNDYLNHTDFFSWIRENRKPLLGICAGMQLISLSFGGRLVEEEPEIGMTEVRVTRDTPLIREGNIRVYALHNFSVTVPDTFLKIAESKKSVHGIMHKSLPVYGFLFHPEVRNRDMIRRFVKLL